MREIERGEGGVEYFIVTVMYIIQKIHKNERTVVLGKEQFFHSELFIYIDK